METCSDMCSTRYQGSTVWCAFTILHVVPHKTEKVEEIFAKMKKYSAALKDPSFFRRHYHAECRNQMDTLFWDTYYRVAKKGIKAGIKYIHIHLKTKAHTNWMRGFFTFGMY